MMLIIRHIVCVEPKITNSNADVAKTGQNPDGDINHQKSKPI